MTDALSASDTRFLRDVEKIQARAERAQRELSSGKRVFDASDEPDGISPLLVTRSEFEANTQIKNNLGRTKAEVDAAENGLQQAVKVLERARVLAGQAQSDFNGDSTYQALRIEASDLTQQLLSVSNLAIEGRYIFSGNSDTVQPFDYDASLASYTPYAGSVASRESLYPGGDPFKIARAGGDIFDSPNPGSSAFAALKQLAEALALPDPDERRAALKTSLESIESSFKHVSGELSFYGAAQRRVYEATAATESTGLRLQTQLKRLEDSDATAAILEIQQSEFAQKAAFQIRGQQSRASLFDYLG